MKVSVSLFGMLREKLPAEAKGKAVLELAEGSRISDVLHRLDITTPVKASVNEELERDLLRQLHDGDSLQLFRPAGGG